MKRYVFFDLDGTLADTNPDVSLAWKAAIADLGLDCPRFDELFVPGPTIDEMAKILFPEIFTPQLADEIRTRFASHYDSDGFPRTTEYPGVMDDVRRFKSEGRVVAIVTNKRHVPTLLLARKFGWDAVFDGIFSSDMGGRRRRKPELLAEAMAALGAKADESALVGDTWNDVEAARANGIAAIGVSWGYGTPAELASADAVFDSPPLAI